MKGRTKCPNCNNDFIIEIPTGKEKYLTTCPNCNHKFNIKKSEKCENLEDECIWEEHGEPRKTILSSIKPRTDKPMIVLLLFGLVFILNMISVISIEFNPDLFYNITFGIFSNISLVFNDNLIFLLIYSLIILIFALIGLIYSYKRKNLKILIICSVICIFSISFYFITSLISTITLILLYYSREEFKNEKKGKIF